MTPLLVGCVPSLKPVTPLLSEKWLKCGVVDRQWCRWLHECSVPARQWCRWLHECSVLGRRSCLSSGLQAGSVRKLLTVCLCGCCPGRLVSFVFDGDLPPRLVWLRRRL